MTALTDDQRAKICATARSYLGVKWRGHGRDHHGINCTGLVECAYINAGMGVEPMPATYRGVELQAVAGDPSALLRSRLA